MYRYAISEQDAKAAKWPHELFLINLIFNHVLLFVAFLSASSLQQLTLIVPVLSFVILGYLLWRGRKSLQVDPWFVKCHWQLAVRRSRMFIIMLGIMIVVMVAIYLISGGNMRPQHWAFFGVGIMPTLVTVLALIVMESDALHLARFGQMPDWLVERYPDGALAPLTE
jgi:formate hydrogenlyase subunit 3/multisubunit Na+/H+ antiporter MnhD subunit